MSEVSVSEQAFSEAALPVLDAEFIHMSHEHNFVCKRGDAIRNEYEFKNIGAEQIPAGCTLQWVSGSQELNAQNIVTLR